MRKAGGTVELFYLYFFTKVERWPEKEINVSSIQLVPFHRRPSHLSPRPLAPTTPPALPGASAAAATVATMTAVLSPTTAFRREVLSQDDSPCVNHRRPPRSIFRSYFSAFQVSFVCGRMESKVPGGC